MIKFGVFLPVIGLGRSAFTTRTVVGLVLIGIALLSKRGTTHSRSPRPARAGQYPQQPAQQRSHSGSTSSPARRRRAELPEQNHRLPQLRS